VGRTVLPAFLLSENRKVGYTFPWVRPPLEVYRLLPVTVSDGLDASYRAYRGEMAHTLQANAGRSRPDLPNNGTAEANRSWGVTYTIEEGPLTIRATYKSTNLTIPSLAPLFGAFRQFGPQGAAIADKYDSDDKLLVNYGIGASYDPGAWFVMSEWNHVDPHSFQGKRIAWYVSGGYRFGKFTPFVNYASSRAGNLSDPGLSLTGLPPAQAAQAAGLNAALNSLLRNRTVQDTVAVGVRWDFMKDVDLKLQFNRTQVGEGSNGVFSNIQPGFRTGARVNVFSAAVDFVF
jgi:predicted porin